MAVTCSFLLFQYLIALFLKVENGVQRGNHTDLGAEVVADLEVRQIVREPHETRVLTLGIFFPN